MTFFAKVRDFTCVPDFGTNTKNLILHAFAT